MDFIAISLQLHVCSPVNFFFDAQYIKLINFFDIFVIM
jgi:hypothetical protein